MPGIEGPLIHARRYWDRKRAVELKAVTAERDRLLAFKAYVHKRLDDAGVPPENPDSEHTAAGCRIGGRLDWVLDVYQNEGALALAVTDLTDPEGKLSCIPSGPERDEVERLLGTYHLSPTYVAPYLNAEASIAAVAKAVQDAALTGWGIVRIDPNEFLKDFSRAAKEQADKGLELEDCACPGCGAMAGCCRSYPDCPGGSDNSPEAAK